eukprot:TRINITY_DN94167_c0_g1_i1.p1 TRINITY_DN94167_c0_g1~~TRINITY_DN94167_c0_g1_i1.p1  ORF type:complete len:717 (-),score=128.34 TRINITY_DN94167_c0_g1_i1:157-2307(-)
MMRTKTLLIAVSVCLLALGAAAEEKESVAQEEQDELNLGVAAMLMGSIAFMMGTFYLVNHSDVDMRIYTWRVICATISIFVAVLIFQAVNENVKHFFLEGVSEDTALVANFVHSLIWFFLLQFFLAVVSGSLVFPCCPPKKRKEHMSKHELDEAHEKLHLNMECWGTILGHITGFASINAWAELQQRFSDSLAMCFLVPVAAFCMVWLFYYIFDQVRERATEADGDTTEGEKAWDETTEETENDIMGLTISFCVVQALRRLVTGQLPNGEGEQNEETWSPSNGQAAALLAIGVLGGLVIFVRVICSDPEEHGEEGGEHEKEKSGSEEFFERAADMFHLSNNFVAAWMLMFGVQTWLMVQGLGGEQVGVIGLVVLANLVTILAFAVISCLDRIADRAKAPGVRKAVQSVVNALGVLIGFSWEKCFDSAVDNTAEKESHILPAALTKLVLAVVLAVIICPAWRWYILPQVKEAEKEQKAAQREGRRITKKELERAMSRNEVDEEKEGYARMEGGDGAKEIEALQNARKKDQQIIAQKDGFIEALERKVRALQDDHAVLKSNQDASAEDADSRMDQARSTIQGLTNALEASQARCGDLEAVVERMKAVQQDLVRAPSAANSHHDLATEPVQGRRLVTRTSGHHTPLLPGNAPTLSARVPRLSAGPQSSPGLPGRNGGSQHPSFVSSPPLRAGPPAGSQYIPPATYTTRPSSSRYQPRRQ